MMGLALGARRSGDLDAAESVLARLRDVYPSSPAGAHLVHAELGFVAELRGDHESAAERGDVERITASAVAVLGRDAFAETFLHGTNNFLDIAETAGSNFS
ncbi:hypothetical protein [Nonomuraea sp. NPDC001831]|uniref:hypothetical protein n=1 Tax=Nonomuraea sp. NPDC001831 TaxID=3364340 RepID=UPI0036999051